MAYTISDKGFHGATGGMEMHYAVKDDAGEAVGFVRDRMWSSHPIQVQPIGDLPRLLKTAGLDHMGYKSMTALKAALSALSA